MRRIGLVVLSTLLIVVTPRSGSAASIEVVNQSSIKTSQGVPFTATIRDGMYGRELVVTGRVDENTTTGETLVKAEVEIIVTQADGSQLWSGLWPAPPRVDLDWRVAVKPFGVLDGALIARVTLRDRQVITVESEREARRRKEAAEAEIRRQREAELAEARAEATRQEEKARAAEAARVRAARAAAAQREAQRQAKIRAYGWPKNIESAVIERRVIPGMTAEQVTHAWGEPRKVNETIYTWGSSEQWVYSSDQYVYFKNGKVTAIQTSR